LFLLAAVPQAASAQVVTIGLKGGRTYATVETNDRRVFGDVDRRTGSVYGVSAAIGGGLLRFRPEMLLVEKGFRDKTAGDDTLLDVDYIEVPLLLVVSLGAGGLRPSIFAGPTVAFERSCTLSGDFRGIDTSGECDLPSIDLNRETTDWGTAFGAELAFSLGSIALSAEARYTLGLTNFVTDADDEARNRVFSLMAGVQIPIG